MEHSDARYFENEAAFYELLAPYRKRAGRIMIGMNAFLLLTCLAIAPMRETYLAVLLIGVPTLALSFWMVQLYTTHGHDAGDEILKIVGQRIGQISRGSDFAARLGGERFLETIVQPILLDKVETAITICSSAGISHIAQGVVDAEVLLKQNGTALYAAKASGKNRVLP